MPRTLYVTDGSSPARAAWMTCLAAGVDVTIRKMDLKVKHEQNEDWFIKLNPRHCVPTLDDEGFSVWESRAVMRYVVDALATEDTLYPRDPRQRSWVDRQLDYDLGRVYREVGQVTFSPVFLNSPPQDQTSVRKELEYLDRKTPLAEGQYITGANMTIADISLIATLSFLETIDFDFSDFPNIVAWRSNMKAVPFYAEANEGFEVWKEEIKTHEWKVKNEKSITQKGFKVHTSVIDN